MSFKKRATKSIVLALVGVTVATPIMNTSYAMEVDSNKTSTYNEVLQENNITKNEINQEKIKREQFDENTPMNELFSPNQVKLAKVDFQNQHGNKDELLVIGEEDGTITKVNGAKGIINIVSPVDGEITINYFETLDELANESIVRAPSRPGAWRTQGPDKANIRVTKGSSRENITIYNPVYGQSYSYTKTLNQWYTGYTKGYYDAIQKARQSWGTSIKYVGDGHNAAYFAVITKLIKDGKFVLSVATLKALVGAAIVGGMINSAMALTYGVAYLANVGEILVNYNRLV